MVPRGSGAGSALVSGHQGMMHVNKQWPNYIVTSEGVRYNFLRRSASGLFQYRSTGGGSDIYGREFGIVQMPAASNSSFLEILSKGMPINSSDSLS